MHKYFTSSIIILLISASFVGCKKSILSDETGDFEAKNVRIKIFSYWNDYLYSKDSLYIINGAALKIDDISILHSDYYFVNDGDTLPTSEPTEWKLSVGGDVQLGYLDEGSYSGFYRFKVGLAPDVNAKAPKDFPASSPLSDQSLYRGPGNGYNFVTITGRIQNPNKPFSEPDIPLKWVFATDTFAIQHGQAQSFNVVTGKEVTFNVILDIAKLFDGIFPSVTPIIKCDPSKPNDFNAAQILQQNFKNEAYKLQL